MTNSLTTIAATKLAPFIGGALILASFQAEAGGVWTTLWRISLSAALGIFTGMAGVIYKAINLRISKMENDIPTRREIDTLIQRFDRLENKLDRRE